MIRLFIALKIPEEIKDKLFSYCFDASENPSRFKWEAKEKIHLTLKFMGDVKEELLPGIIDEIEFVKSYSNIQVHDFKIWFFLSE